MSENDASANFRRSTLDAKSFKSRVFNAGGWALIGHFSTLILRLAGTLILTRIFSPDAFGILAVVTAVQVVIGLLTDIGLRQAVVQSHNGEKQEFLTTAWSLQIMRGGVIAALGAACALALSLVAGWQLVAEHSVYANPELSGYLAVASLSAVLMGLQSMKAVTAGRELQLGRLFVIELTAQIIGLAFVIAVGWYTRSVWCYILGLLLSSALTTLLSHVWLNGPPDRLGWDQNALKELFHFGRWTFLSSMLSALSMNGDRLLLGGWVNAQVLGFYSIAYNLANVAEGLASRVFGSVSFPALSEAVRHQPDRVPEMFYRMRWITDPALLFAAGFLLVTGPTVIRLLYDPRYASAGWMLQYLSFSLVFARYGIAQNAYLALGRPDYVTVLSVTKLLSLFGLMPLLYYFFGIEGAVLGVAFHMLPVALWTFYFNHKHGLNNIRLELVVLLAWLCGWLFGVISIELASACCALRVL
jgi:O-antigen/teichoic acid export membrane protein